MSIAEALTDTLASRFFLRACSRVGARPHVDGKPFIKNLGVLNIGDDFVLRSRPIQSHLVVWDGGTLTIGNGVRVGAGAAVSCNGQVDIEDDVGLGAYCMLMDSDFHVAGNSDSAAAAKPIRIGRGARVGHRVVILPGSRIGDFAVVEAGSVVSGEVLPRVTVRGNPARVFSSFAETPEGDDALSVVPVLVKQVLGLARLPEPSEGPEQIPEWDSLGTLRLILALEEHFVILLTEDELRTARSIQDLADRVDAAKNRQAAASAT